MTDQGNNPPQPDNSSSAAPQQPVNAEPQPTNAEPDQGADRGPDKETGAPEAATPSGHASPSGAADSAESASAAGTTSLPKAPQLRDGVLKPGVVPLRPLGLGDILDGAVTTMRKYPAPVLGMSAAVAVVNAALTYLVSLLTADGLRRLSEIDSTANSEEQVRQLGPVLGNFALVGGAGTIIGVLTSTFLTGFLTVIIGKAVLGRPISIGDALKELKPRFLPLLGLSVLYVIIVAVATIFFIIPGIWLYVLFSLATAALVLEQIGIGRAFRRSAQLVKGSWWRVFGVLIVGFVISFAVAAIIELPFGLSGGILGGGSSLSDIEVPTASESFLQAVASFISGTITAPLVAGITALLYIDQRMRKEGMDIQLARSATASPA